MVLVEGEKADGVSVDHDAFDVTSDADLATSSPAADQVIEAILGTQESAADGGHHLKAIGVAWSDHAEGAALRDGLTARGIDDVMLVSEGHAAAALAQAVGRTVGYDTTALLFIDRDTATLSVVQTDDGSVVKVLSRTLHADDAMSVLTDMAAAVDGRDPAPQALFVVGSGVDVSSVKAHLETLVAIPVSAPDEPEFALARGAALAAANAPAFEPTTIGLAYSQDPDGPTAGSPFAGAAYAAFAAAETQLGPVGEPYLDDDEPRTDLELPAGERKPFLLVGTALTSIFIVGVVALVISLAVSIRPTADQRPGPAESAIVPSIAAPAPRPVEPAPEAKPVEPPPPAPPAETIKAPVPVVQQAPQAPPRTVYVEQPVAKPAPPPEAPPPAPAPEAPPPAPAPPPAAPVVPAPAPVFIPPGAYSPFGPPPIYYPRQRPWNPPSYQQPWDPWPQQPPRQIEEPKRPPVPEVPQGPWPGSGGRGSYGNGGYGGGHGGGHSGGSCFLIFCG